MLHFNKNFLVMPIGMGQEGRTRGAVAPFLSASRFRKGSDSVNGLPGEGLGTVLVDQLDINRDVHRDVGTPFLGQCHADGDALAMHQPRAVIFGQPLQRMAEGVAEIEKRAVALLGLVQSPLALWAIPAIFLTGLAFAAPGLIVTALAPSYDYFMYYFTLFITPMTLLSGVFFPLDQLPAGIQAISQLLPLTHSVALIRPLLFGQIPDAPLLHVAVLAAMALVCFWIALGLTRRRLLS